MLKQPPFTLELAFASGLQQDLAHTDLERVLKDKVAPLLGSSGDKVLAEKRRHFQQR